MPFYFLCCYCVWISYVSLKKAFLNIPTVSLEIQEDRKVVQPLATETGRVTSVRKERTLAVDDVAGKWGPVDKPGQRSNKDTQ